MRILNNLILHGSNQLKIADKVEHVTVETYTLPPHNKTNCYVIGEDCDALLIDAICHGGNEVSSCLRDNSIRSIKYSAITHPHPDHYSGLDRILSDFGGKALCHPDTASYLTTQIISPDDTAVFSGEETLHVAGNTIQVLHTPGHFTGHLCFYLKEQKILFSGDTILGRGTTIISPPEGDMTDYLKTLNMLAAMDIDIICPGHGPIIRGNVRKVIQWYIEHRMMREQRIISALKSGLNTIPKIAEKIYTKEDFLMHGYDLIPRAERVVLAHLLKLENEHMVTKHNSQYFLA